MRIRTYLEILLGVVAVVALSAFAGLNRELLSEPFHLTPQTTLPLSAAFVLVFLAGLLPAASILLVQSLRRDLTERRERRRSREAESLDSVFRRAVDFQADGQHQRAAVELEVLLTERPEHFPALLRYGEVLRARGDAAKALEVHQRASVLYPGSLALLYQLVEDYEALGEAQVAREIRNRIVRDFPGGGLEVMRRRRDRALAARSWEEAGRWHDRVENLLRETGEERPREREVGISRGLAYQRGVALLEKDRAGEAALVFRKLLEEEPRFVPAGIMLGEAGLLQEDPAAAVEQWRHGFLSTGSPVFLQRIEDHFIEAEAPARAIETLRGLIARSENDLLPRFFLGRLYYRLEMHEEALKVLGGLAERLDPSPTYHYLLGRIHQRRGELPAAVARYTAGLKRLGVSSADFLCRGCQTRAHEWHDRCEVCGSWNSIDLDVREEKLSAEMLGLRERPVWGGDDEVESARPADELD